MPGHLPLIGVSTSITVDKHPERAYVNSTYLHAIQQAGGVPVTLPPQLSAASLDRLARGLDGLLLTGGGDLDPALFGEAPHATLYDVAPARDTVEATVVRIALDRRLPILAICRGLQVLNVALGGSLYQDVGTEPGTEIMHSQEAPRDQPSHKVVRAGSRSPKPSAPTRSRSIACTTRRSRRWARGSGPWRGRRTRSWRASSCRIARASSWACSGTPRSWSPTRSPPAASSPPS